MVSMHSFVHDYNHYRGVAVLVRVKKSLLHECSS